MASIKSLTKNELIALVTNLQGQVAALTAQCSKLVVQGNADRAALIAATSPKVAAPKRDTLRIVAQTEEEEDIMFWFDKGHAMAHREAATLKAREAGLPYNYGVNTRHGCYAVTRYLKAR